MLFVRDFKQFAGGHLKFLDYMRHTAASGLATPVFYQTARSRAAAGNPFNDYEGHRVPELRAFPSYFIAGMDWFILDAARISLGKAPVINLIQGFRHADPLDPLFDCLRRPALRICVSPAVADAVRAHSNGEVHTICNGISITLPAERRALDSSARVFIGGMKNPPVARAVGKLLEHRMEVDLVTEPLPRPEFLARIAAATICVFLPGQQEGFFLPPLEAMMLGRGVVVPDCGGNRAYCRPSENCLMPPYEADALGNAALALAHDSSQLCRLAAAGLETAKEHSIEQERSAYHRLLSRYLGHGA